MQRGIGNRTLQRRYGGSPGKRLTGRPMEARPQDREHRVLDALHRAAVFCDERIGWNRIGVALSLTIITVAAVVLYRILRTIDASEVVERSEEHTSELQSLRHLVCRLLLEKKK